MSYPFIIAELIANIFILGLGIAIWIVIIGVFTIVVQILVEKFTTKGNQCTFINYWRQIKSRLNLL